MSVIRLAASKPICTHQELAAMEFEPWPSFIGFDNKPGAAEGHRDQILNLGRMSKFAIAVLGLTKEQLIEKVREIDANAEANDDENDVTADNFLRYMVCAREDLEELLTIVTTAEYRHACAIANVYAEDGSKLPPLPKPPSSNLPRRQRRKMNL
jgi:hypothetical protein